MKQIIQNYNKGDLSLNEVPVPALKNNGILIKTKCSLVSGGTESHMIGFAKKNILKKALARPDLVKKVIDKIKAEGFWEAYKLSKNRLDDPVPLGYSCSGEVIEVGKNVTAVSVGERVACSGSGYASHAEVNYVPENLFVHVPDAVTDEEAAFAMVGGIVMQAIRCADVKIGESIVVIGMGLLGLIGVQMLNASATNVIGCDIDSSKCGLAEELGIERTIDLKQEDAAEKVMSLTGGKGADAVIIFANTPDNEPIELAAELVREHGKIVVPGLVGLDLPRKIFYEKEIDLIVSRASGPGMYDADYLEKGIDYPYGEVRWTSARNVEAFLDLVSNEKIDLKKLITHEFNINDALRAYELITGKGEKDTPPIGVILKYDREIDIRKESQVVLKPVKKAGVPKIGIGLIGGGMFAKSELLPALKKLSGYDLIGVSTTSGKSCGHIGKKYGFEYCTTDYKKILEDKRINTVMILTRHGSHGKFVQEALNVGKNVYVEKPLCLNKEELKGIIKAYSEKKAKLFVGFNRRYSPFTRFIKKKMDRLEGDISLLCRVNAGYIEKESWVHDPEDGGGRIIGEVCHFVDLAQFLTDSVPVKVYTESISGSERYFKNDNVSISLHMKNGAMAMIMYTASGPKSFSRERIEVFRGGEVGVIENFRKAYFSHGGALKKWSIDRGYRAELKAFLESLKVDKEEDISGYLYTTLATFCAEESLKKGEPVIIDIAGLLEK